MNPQENEICVDNIRPENVRHLKFTLHFEDWTWENDFRQDIFTYGRKPSIFTISILEGPNVPIFYPPKSFFGRFRILISIYIESKSVIKNPIQVLKL